MYYHNLNTSVKKDAIEFARKMKIVRPKGPPDAKML